MPRNIGRYCARSGVRLKILPSEGSFENLKRLSDPSFRADLGFVQGGFAAGLKIDDLQSLGSLYSSPILLFYRSVAPFDLLFQLSEKRLAIGSVGSGSHALALSLLAANGIEPGGSTALENLDAEDASKALFAGKLDAVFLMGESAPPEVMRSLLRTPGIRLYSYSQADAYVRRMVYLNKLHLPGEQ